jgi:hypothetical protein
MNRAFVLINHERRRESTRRITNMAEGEDRQIPVRFPEDEKPVVTTTMRAIIFLISYTSALVLAVAFIFKFLVASEVTNLRLELARDYARRSDVVMRQEWMDSERSMQRQLDAPVQISKEAETRLKAVESRLDRAELALDGRMFGKR